MYLSLGSSSDRQDTDCSRSLLSIDKDTDHWM
jgi:hypothetical protein